MVLISFHVAILPYQLCGLIPLDACQRQAMRWCLAYHALLLPYQAMLSSLYAVLLSYLEYIPTLHAIGHVMVLSIQEVTVQYVVINALQYMGSEVHLSRGTAFPPV